MILHDLRDYDHPDAWAGLALEVDEPRKPRFRVEYASPGLLRLTFDEVPLLWLRWHGGFEGFSSLRAASVPTLVPPMTAALAREADAQPRRWAPVIARTLIDSGILHHGAWELQPACTEKVRGDHHGTVALSSGRERIRALSVSDPKRALTDRDPERWPFDLAGGGWLVGLRAPSAPDAARVKAWRKAARDGILPPIIIYFVSLLDSWILLDGHDRLLASVLEDVPAPMFAVSSVRHVATEVDTSEQSALYRELAVKFGGAGPLDASTTRALRVAFRSKFPGPTFTVWRTRAWSMPGGRDAWEAEVRERLCAIGTDPEIFNANAL